MQKKCRRWGIILWTDNDTHINALDYIKRNYQNYIYILHNCDVKEDNTLKKAHYHVLLYFPNQKSLSSLKNQLHLNDSDFYEIKSFTGQLRYLIHYDDDDKFQYDVKDVRGTTFMMKKFLLSIRNISNEEDECSAIVDFILNYRPTLFGLYDFVNDNNCYSTFRRNYTFFRDLLKERRLYDGKLDDKSS